MPRQPEAFVDHTVTCRAVLVDTQIGGDPPVAMCGMIRMNTSDIGQQLLAINRACRLAALLPFVVAGAAYAHDGTHILYRIVS